MFLVSCVYIGGIATCTPHGLSWCSFDRKHACKGACKAEPLFLNKWRIKDQGQDQCLGLSLSVWRVMPLLLLRYDVFSLWRQSSGFLENETSRLEHYAKMQQLSVDTGQEQFFDLECSRRELALNPFQNLVQPTRFRSYWNTKNESLSWNSKHLVESLSQIPAQLHLCSRMAVLAYPSWSPP